MKSQKKTRPALWTQMKGGIKPRQLAKVLRTDRQVKRARRIKVVSDSRAKQMREYAKIKREFLKQYPFCECYTMRDKRRILICEDDPHRAADIHHRRGRIGSLLTDTQFFTPVCRQAHLFIHAHPSEAKALGLILAGWNSAPKD